MILYIKYAKQFGNEKKRANSSRMLSYIFKTLSDLTDSIESKNLPFKRVVSWEHISQ